MAELPARGTSLVVHDTVPQTMRTDGEFFTNKCADLKSFATMSVTVNLKG
jgi:hypothetical protein